MMKWPVVCLVAAIALADPWVENKDFSRELQEKAYSATLRVTMPSGATGSAVRVFRNTETGKTIYITAAHVVGKTDSVDLEWFDPKTGDVAKKVRAKVWEVSPASDLALLGATEEKPSPVIPICPKEKVPSDTPFPALSVGCQLGSPDLWPDDEVKKKVPVNEIDNGTTASFWRVGKTTVSGRSGGPLIDKNGNLVGICKGKIREDSYYVHIEEVHKCLKDKGWDRYFTQQGKKVPEKQKN